MLAQVTLATEGEGTMIAWDFSVDGRRVSEDGCCPKGSCAFVCIKIQAAHVTDVHQLLLTLVAGGTHRFRRQLDPSIRFF